MDTIEIHGLGPEPVIVNEDLSISQPTDAPDQDVMAEMRASIEAAEAEKPAALPAPAEGQEKLEGGPATEAPKSPDVSPEGDTAPEGEKTPEGEAEAKEEGEEKPAAEEKEKPEGEEAEKPKEGEEEKKEGEEEEKPAAEPSEADKLVEAVGGVEVVQKLEALRNAELPVSERLAVLTEIVPAEQVADLRNEMFWQAVENPKTQEVLLADVDVRSTVLSDQGMLEAFAQKLGVPYEFLEHVVEEQKGLYEQDEIEQIVTDRRAAAGTKEKPAAEKQPAAAKTEEKPPAEEKKDAPQAAVIADFTPEYNTILGDLSNEVDTVLTPANLTAEELKEFETRLPALWMADADAMKSLGEVKNLATKETAAEAHAKFPDLAAHAKRVAASLVTEITAKRAPAKAAEKPAPAPEAKKPAAKPAAAPKPAATAAQKKDVAPPAKAGALPDLSDEAAVTRAMEERIAQSGGG